MKELPYFKFTLQEWQNGDITTMSDSCQGVFINVCVFYWASNCDVTEERLLRRFRNSKNTVQKLIKSGVIKCQKGIVSVSFLDQQFLELIKTNHFYSECGKKGQKAKKSKAPLKPPLQGGLSYNIKEDKIKEDPPKWLFPKWVEWEQHRLEIRKKLTPSTVNKQIKLLTENKEDAFKIIDQSIMNGWAGLFKLDKKMKTKNEPPKEEYLNAD